MCFKTSSGKPLAFCSLFQVQDTALAQLFSLQKWYKKEKKTQDIALSGCHSNWQEVLQEFSMQSSGNVSAFTSRALHAAGYAY